MHATDMSGVATRRWSRAEYERMVEHGLFQPGERVELVDGEILTLAPQKSLHATAIGLAQIALGTVFGAGAHVRVQGPLALDPDSEPEPDLAVVNGSPPLAAPGARVAVADLLP